MQKLCSLMCVICARSTEKHHLLFVSQQHTGQRVNRCPGELDLDSMGWPTYGLHLSSRCVPNDSPNAVKPDTGDFKVQIVTFKH